MSAWRPHQFCLAGLQRFEPMLFVRQAEKACLSRIAKRGRRDRFAKIGGKRGQRAVRIVLGVVGLFGDDGADSVPRARIVSSVPDAYAAGYQLRANKRPAKDVAIKLRTCLRLPKMRGAGQARSPSSSVDQRECQGVQVPMPGGRRRVRRGLKSAGAGSMSLPLT